MARSAIIVGGRRGRPSVRIAIVSPTWFPVSSKFYGGAEAVVGLLADGLAAAGHDVTLFAAGGSATTADLVATFTEAPSDRIGTTMAELLHALVAFERAADFDIINDHSGPLAAALGCSTPTPVVHTVHTSLAGAYRLVYEKLDGIVDELNLVSLSASQQEQAPHLPWTGKCRNAVDLDVHQSGACKGDYLLFFSRISPQKGPRQAIEVVRAASLPLKLAGKLRHPNERRFFEQEVEPLLGDGVEYLGEVSRDQKVALMQGARALLFPIEWSEPFGLIMIESMACGTPVLATRRGAVPEVIADGRTGMIVDEYRDMVDALDNVLRLDAEDCVSHVAQNFTVEQMVRDYEGVYANILQSRP